MERKPRFQIYHDGAIIVRVGWERVPRSREMRERERSETQVVEELAI
jgi:hypothetical protein